MITPYYDKNGITIYHADCRDVLAQLAPGSVDLCVTDSAYKVTSGGNTEGRSMGGIFHKDVYNNDGELFPTLKFSEWVPPIFRALKADADFYSMVNDKNLRDMLNTAHDAGFSLHNTLVWHKGTKTPNRWYMKSCEFTCYFWKGNARPINNMGSDQYNNTRAPKKRKHKTEKPVLLMAEFVSNSSQVDDVVIDPFMGSGSTAKACLLLRRRCITIDINEQDCETTARELDKMTPYTQHAEQIGMIV